MTNEVFSSKFGRWIYNESIKILFIFEMSLLYMWAKMFCGCLKSVRGCFII